MRIRAWMHIVLLVVLIGYGFAAAAGVSPDPSFLQPPDTAAAPTGLPPAATIDRPWGIAAGHDGALWFTELDGNRIGRITVGGVIQEFPIPTPRSGPVGIVWGPDNAIWFTEAYADQIGRLDPATGHITEYASPQLGIQPGVLAVGGDGALYFTQNGYGNIGRFTPSTGRFDRFGLSPGRTLGLVRGPDGAIWFTSSWGGALQIGRLSPDGGILYYHDQGQFGSAASDAITVGPDGALWFTQTGSSAIGRLTTAGSFSRFPVIGRPAQALTTGSDGNLWYGRPDDGFGVVSTTGWSRAFYLADQVLQAPIENIAVGLNGSLWFTVPDLDQILQRTANGDLIRFSIPSAPPIAYGLAAAPDGSAWFTMPESNRVGHVDRTGHIRLFHPPTLDSQPAGIVAAPDGSAWFAEFRSGRMAHISEGGVIHEYATLPFMLRPESVALLPTGQVWWTESPFPLLGSLDPKTGAIEQHLAPLSADLDSIAAGTDGRLWLTEDQAQAIARFTPSTERWTIFPLPKPGGDPFAVSPAPNGGAVFLVDGTAQVGYITSTGHISLRQDLGLEQRIGIAATPNLTYFTDAVSNRIGRISASGALSYLPIPTVNSEAGAIVVTSNGGAWFLEIATGRLGHIDPVSGVIHDYLIPATR